MKLSRKRFSIPVLLLVTLLWASCKKEASNQSFEKPQETQIRVSGGVEDDPIRVRKVPMIISLARLKKAITDAALLDASLRGKPVKVNITSPVNGDSVSGTVTITVSTVDTTGISVKMSDNGTQVGTDNSFPYRFSWNAANAGSGLHKLTATATNVAGGNSSSNSIVVTVNTTILPPSPTTLSTNVQLKMPPVGYQGSEGSCSVFAVVYAARSCEQYYRSNATSYSESTNIFSPEFVFNQIKMGACSSSSLGEALDLIVREGVCTWQTMPYSGSDGCSLLPNTSQYADAAKYKIASYSALLTSDITAMKTKLANNHPITMSFANDNNFNTAGPDYIWNAYDASKGYGLHAITICGYDDSKHAYKAINSWGTTWGSAGYIWIDYDFLPTVQTTVYVMN
jgi:Papain family cysteine protease/Bacterial Ig domain